MPIHNEEKLLPYSLPSVFTLNPSETILLFDHCTDNSKKIAYDITAKHQMLHKVKFVDVNSLQASFKFSHAFLRYYGSKISTNDIVLLTNADMVLDPEIINHIDSVGKDNLGLISFLYVNYPVDWRLLIKRLFSNFRHKNLLGPILLYNRNYGFELEDINKLKKIELGQDTHLQQAISKKYKTLCHTSKTVHLRPMESQRHYRRGKHYWNQLHKPFLYTLLSGIMVLRFNLLKGYIHARLGGCQ